MPRPSPVSKAARAAQAHFWGLKSQGVRDSGTRQCLQRDCASPFGARARARREPAHIRKGGSGAYKHSQNHGMDDVFAASEQTKIEDKDSEKTRTLYFTMFVACRTYAERRFGSPQTQPKPWYGRCITPHLVNFFWGVMSPPKYFFKIISKNQFPK